MRQKISERVPRAMSGRPERRVSRVMSVERLVAQHICLCVHESYLWNEERVYCALVRDPLSGLDDTMSLHQNHKRSCAVYVSSHPQTS